jgi:hypothetical protein
MVQALSREDRQALIEQLEELKCGRYDSCPGLDHTLDAEARFRFGVMIYRAVAAISDVDLSQSVFFFA